MIVCPRCSKENQDHYKFCLGCGAELPRDQAAPKDFAPPPPPPPQTPPVGAPVASAGPGGAAVASPASKDKNLQFAATQQGDSSDLAVAAAVAAERRPPTDIPAPPAAAPPKPAAPPPSVPVPAAAAAGLECPSCGSAVPQDFKFCGSCGHRMEGGGPSPSPVPPSPPAPTPMSGSAHGTLVLINPDGSEGDTHTLTEANAAVGRNVGGLFAADSYLSPVHATFLFAQGGCTIRDEGSLNGVYLKIPRDQPVELAHGMVFRIGQEIIRFEEVRPSPAVDGVETMGSPNPGFIGRISLVIGRNTTANAFVIPPEGMHIGRERGDVIFPDDGYVSGLHCRIHSDGSGVSLTDVGSSNGTFVRVDGERQCSSGELLLMGQQLFRLQY